MHMYANQLKKKNYHSKIELNIFRYIEKAGMLRSITVKIGNLL